MSQETEKHVLGPGKPTVEAQNLSLPSTLFDGQDFSRRKKGEMDSNLETIFILQIIYLVLHLGANFFGLSLLSKSKGKAGTSFGASVHSSAFALVQTRIPLSPESLLFPTPGLTPENPKTNFFVDLCLLASIAFAIYSGDTRPHALLCAGIFLVPICFGTVKHLRQYFIFKAMLRQARQHYKVTGEKSNLDMEGYTSLNTLMLAVVINIYGFFAVGCGVRRPALRARGGHVCVEEGWGSVRASLTHSLSFSSSGPLPFPRPLSPPPRAGLLYVRGLRAEGDYRLRLDELKEARGRRRG